MKKSWVIIPLYNEEQIISEVITGLKPFFDHILCIDDGSNDKSVSEALNAGALVAVHPINLGQGAALQTGFEIALLDPEMTEIVTFDADGQHSPSDAASMVDLLRNKSLDVVIGSRFLDSRTNVSFLKKLVLKLAAAVSRLTSGMHLTDAHNGLRVINRSTLSKLHITQNRMAHATEIIELISELNVSWAEFPTHITYTDYSKSKGQSLLNAINIFIDLIIK